MNTKILLGMLVVMVLTACEKNNFNTEPTLTLKSVSDKVVPPGGIMNIRLEATDKEGDISDTLYYSRIRNNIRQVPPADLLGIDSVYKIPDLVNTRKIDLIMNLEHRNHLMLTTRSQYGNDSITLKIWMTDKAKNKSNEIIIENVVVLK